MMLASITPVILTYNEAPNIARTLAGLAWAKKIVVVDSFSDDETVEILRAHGNVSVFQRKFDLHANQWNYAIDDTGINSEWILALDADYVVSPRVEEELRRLTPTADVDAYEAAFEYCIFGRALHGSVYPPVKVLFRHGRARYVQDGHTQRLHVSGKTDRLENPLQHDDRKPIGRWLAAQSGYMQLEAEKLARTPASELPMSDRVRKMVFVAPVLVFFYSLFVRRCVLDGRAGMFYALQRTVAELILSMYLLRRYLT
jgi:glycosyltransferase involved in cell wall biosynthesis